MLHSAFALGGMVTAPHAAAAQAGREVLRQGGGAIEAMVAAAATVAVAYPHMNGLGGDGFWLIHRPGRPPIAIRACGRSAGLATPQFYAERGFAEVPTRGPEAALTVAGAVSGWREALAVAGEDAATLPLPVLLADAVRHARGGVVVTESQARLSTTKHGELQAQPGFAQVFLKGGQAPRAGAVLQQPALAATLERLAESGLDDFYRGDVGAEITRSLERLGSPLRRGDLEAHRAVRTPVLSAELDAGVVMNLPAPTQGASALMILGLFDRLAPADADGFAHVHAIVEATKRAFRLRDQHVGDPDRMTVDPAGWLTPEVLDRESRLIDLARAAPWPAPVGDGDTVWLGAADRHGVVVSYIQSLYWEFGSGVVAGPTGILWQNRGASFTLAAGPRGLAPGRLPFHTLNPAMAHLRDGRVMAYGSMGGDGQPQTQAAIFSRYVRYGQGLQAAVTAPRWLLGRTWGATSTTLKLEDRFGAKVRDALAAAGHAVEMVEPFSDLMGHAGAVVRHPDGVLEAACDPRSDGACAGL